MKDKHTFTGDDKSENWLLQGLQESIEHAQSIDLIVSFIMHSGVKSLIAPLKQAAQRGVPIRILCGNYLNITQPEALYMLKSELQDSLDLRFYNDPNRSFHVKSYFFHEKERSVVYIGSSNLSKSALTSGIEWNYCFDTNTDPINYKAFYETFLDLFENHAEPITDKVLKKYAASYKKPDLTLSRQLDFEESGKIVPRGAQVEALYALKQMRASGANKALVQAATGVGKTYLAAFDSFGYKRVLFLAHRAEILLQAKHSFQKVSPQKSSGLFMGAEKECRADCIFASVQSLGKKEEMEKYFPPDAFDYIVIDEFHHAAAKSYQAVLAYFRPKFLLGLSATPERLDGKDVYALLDYNVAYEISLAQSINRGLLVPFVYHGIYDETNYDNVRFVKGKYDEKELSLLYITNQKRTELIYHQYRKFSAKKALAFCTSKEHALYMCEAFRSYGIQADVLLSGMSDKERKQTLHDFRSGSTSILFSVDILNEGADIPEVDMVLFLRPTQSSAIFLQQLGRGLRIAPNKTCLHVLDFIGNYRNANKVLQLISDTSSPLNYPRTTPTLILPQGCMADFDWQLIDLFEEMEKKQTRLTDLVDESYTQYKQEFEEIPSRKAFFLYMDDALYQKIRAKKALNPFKDYLTFKEKHHDLSPEEEKISEQGKAFLHLLETTSMSKVYKMPVLLSFLRFDKTSLSKEELLISWKEFFAQSGNWIDLAKSYQEFEQISDKAHLYNILHNPVHFLIQSGQGYFQASDNGGIQLSANLENDWHSPAFLFHFQDILDLRILDYYQNRYHAQTKKLA
jgi:superfamily II DNA or RNA helicase